MLLAALTGLVGGVFVFLTDYDGPPEGGSDGERDVFDALSCSHGAGGGVGLRQPVSGYLRPLETRGPGKAQAPPQRHLQQISPSRRCDQLFDRACPFLYPTLALSAVTQSPEHTAPGFAVCAYPTRSRPVLLIVILEQAGGIQAVGTLGSALIAVDAGVDLCHLLLPELAQPALGGGPADHEAHAGAVVDDDLLGTGHTVSAPPAEAPGQLPAVLLDLHLDGLRQSGRIILIGEELLQLAHAPPGPR